MHPAESSMVEARFQVQVNAWGFRLSKVDSLVLIGSVLATALLWNWTQAYSWIGFLVVFHFFLFCNVFRIPRGLELLWGFCFLVSCLGLTAIELLTPLSITLAILPVTVAILTWSLRLKSYHGVFANRINRHLEDYLTVQRGRHFRR